MSKRQSGFTLIELIITVTIMGILLGLAIPSYQRFIQNARITSETTDLQSFFMMARGEAIKRGQNVWISNGSKGWTGTLTAFVDVDNDKEQSATEQTIGVLSSLREIALIPGKKAKTGIGYSPNGSLVGEENIANGSIQLTGPNLIDNPGYMVGCLSFGSNGRTTMLRFDTPKEPKPDCNE